MKDARAIFRFLLDAIARGERTALVTITDVIGGSSRAPGAHMAVTENGGSLGSFSGGCVEAAVVGEAQRIIVGGTLERIRFGADSPLIDIRLPCGGGIDLMFVPDPDPVALEDAWQLLSDREAIALRIAGDGSITTRPASLDIRSAWVDDAFVAGHVPDVRLVLLGHGTEILALGALGMAYGSEVTVLSPDDEIVLQASAFATEAFLLKTPARTPHLLTDNRTAVVFLFHDHDWETELLAQVLEQNPFYVGGMGSRQTHETRMRALLDLGVEPEQVSRVIGPIGLIPRVRDPETLALSVLAQIIEVASTPDVP